MFTLHNSSSLLVAKIMELALNNSSLSVISLNKGPKGLKLQGHRKKTFKISSALPETVVSVTIATAVVGAAATVLVKRTQQSGESQTPLKICEDCGGSGICPECKGEGFVLQKLSEESAERARMMSKDAATRYTSGLPRKWSYCTKCTSARSCRTCSGSGKLSL
ncbi:Chaperone protein DnaJ [Bienertia sinuspersici]